MHTKNDKIEAKTVSYLTEFELENLSEATIDTMNETAGFTIGTQPIDPVYKERIRGYWDGVLLVPERVLIIGLYDGAIAGSVQLILPSPSNRTSHFSCSFDNHFVAPWARGNGLSNLLLEHAENEAKERGLIIVKLSVRKNREAAIRVFESRNYVKWGELPKYELDQGVVVPGCFYYKEL